MAPAKAFREAEAMQAEQQPYCPRLYSLQGYRYCDLLLGPVRRHGPGPGAWSGLDGVDLSLGRAHFGLTLCGEGAGEDGSAEAAKVHLDRAVEGLRHGSRDDHLPRALLARAAFRRVHANRTSAEADLDEAEEIAERGRMLLRLADVHLERTLLHLASGEDARARERLDAAAELVERCGYGRRRPALEFLAGVLRERS